jgi:hypothetical protein
VLDELSRALLNGRKEFVHRPWLRLRRPLEPCIREVQ